MANMVYSEKADGEWYTHYSDRLLIETGVSVLRFRTNRKRIDPKRFAK